MCCHRLEEEEGWVFCTTCGKCVDDEEQLFVKAYQCQRFHEGEWQSFDEVYCEDCYPAAQQEYDEGRQVCGFGDCPFGCHASGNEGEDEGEDITM